MAPTQGDDRGSLVSVGVSLLTVAMCAQEATLNRGGSEALSGMSNGRRVSRNSLDTRNMAQFISMQPARGVDYDAAAEEVLAKVCLGTLTSHRQPAAL